MQANLYINDVIGSTYDYNGNLTEKGFELLDLIQQVQKYPEAESYNLFICTPGGSVEVGFQIYDYLKSLGKPVHTIGHSMVASIGTVVFMAGEKRTLNKGTDFFIHLPSGGVHGTSEDINDYASMISEIQTKILKFYKEHTGLQEEGLLPLLRNETTLTVEQAYDLGFANTQPKQVEPVAFYKKSSTNINTNKTMSTKDDEVTVKKDWLETQFEAITKLFTTKPKNVTETTADGETMIDFPNVEEGQPIAVGEEATIDGLPAEGEYVMPSGMTFVFSGGILEAINEPEVEEEGMTEDEMNKIISDLKEQISKSNEEKESALANSSTLQAENEQLKKDVKNIKTQFETFKTELETKFDFKAVVNIKEEEVKENESQAKKAYKNLINKRKK